MMVFLADWGRSQEETRLRHCPMPPGSAVRALKSLNWAPRHMITLLGGSALIKSACRQEILGQELPNQSRALLRSISQPTAAKRRRTMAPSSPKDGLAGRSSLFPLLFTYPTLDAAQLQAPTTDTSHYRSAAHHTADGCVPSLSISPAAAMSNASASRQINTTGHPGVPISLRSTELMVQKHSAPLRSATRASDHPRTTNNHSVYSQPGISPGCNHTRITPRATEKQNPAGPQDKPCLALPRATHVSQRPREAPRLE